MADSEGPKGPIYVPKQEGQIELTKRESINLVVQLQDEMRAAKKILDNAKEVVKTHMVADGETSHTTPEGHTAKWSSSQRPKYDKEAIKELTGAGFDLCVSFSTVKSFTVK
jgi:hypothetical protein